MQFFLYILAGIATFFLCFSIHSVAIDDDEIADNAARDSILLLILIVLCVK